MPSRVYDRWRKPSFLALDPLRSAAPGLWRGNVFAVQFVADRLPPGVAYSQGANVSVQPGLRGPELVLAGGTTSAYNAMVTVPQFVANSPITVAGLVRGNTGSAWFGSSSAAYEVVLRPSGTGVEWILNSFSSNDRCNGGSADWTTHHLIAGTWDGVALRAYIDGVQVATATPTGSWNVAAFPGVAIGAIRDDSSEARLTGAVATSYLWDRALTEAELRQLAADPFIMFRPKPRRTWYVQAPVGGFQPAWARGSNQIIQVTL